MSQVIAVIPARGGSKRIPRKNLLRFRGRPMVAWSIEAALESRCFDRVVVSTDDREIAAVARSWGAEVPFERPLDLAADWTPTIPVIRHAIESLETADEPIGHVCCLYATAPFVDSAELQRGWKMINEFPTAEFVISMTTYAFPIYRSVRLVDSGFVEMVWKEHELTRSQDLPETYHDAGQFYWGTRAAYMTHQGFFSARAMPLVLPRHCVQDIDTPEDWSRAELMHETIERRRTREAA